MWRTCVYKYDLENSVFFFYLSKTNKLNYVANTVEFFFSNLNSNFFFQIQVVTLIHDRPTSSYKITNFRTRDPIIKNKINNLTKNYIESASKSYDFRWKTRFRFFLPVISQILDLSQSFTGGRKINRWRKPTFSTRRSYSKLTASCDGLCCDKKKVKKKKTLTRWTCTASAESVRRRVRRRKTISPSTRRQWKSTKRCPRPSQS